uniref:Jingzhaotoxin F7-10.36 n=1 Tax=Chilobrachys guangxiensis TaxID=278060 RepID=JZ710_CHIGU|nr:RecName: Full=Jingzhaotoxin F7-10.36; AltName: Full=Peptide F7-10.36 [Chilobrachys guangxiensis]8FD4_A Chain A, Jingzhaotoxin F7-10.36 [Chilobrachys guangxiensis]
SCKVPFNECKYGADECCKGYVCSKRDGWCKYHIN